MTIFQTTHTMTIKIGQGQYPTLEFSDSLIVGLIYVTRNLIEEFLGKIAKLGETYCSNSTENSYQYKITVS